MSEAPQTAWYYSKDNERIGPLSFADLKVHVAEGQVHPRSDLVWTPGMEVWKPAGEIDGLFERVVAVTPAQVAVVQTANPYQSGSTNSDDSTMARQPVWPGFGRATFVIGAFIFVTLAIVGPILLTPFAKGFESAVRFVPRFCLGFTIWLGRNRLTNVGMSRWWYFANFVPILNLWVGYRLVVCPPGYAYHKKLDGIGIFFAVCYWLLVSVVIISMVTFIYLLYKNLADPQVKKQILDAFNNSTPATPEHK
jgi:hypothetical protein